MKTKILLICFFSVLFSINALIAQNFGGGSGVQNDPFLIKVPEHMQELHTLDWSKWSEEQPPYFRLENDLDMKNIDWVPLNSASPYSKHIHFDGNSHIIRNLTCINQNYASLFGVLCGSCKNLGLVDVNMVSDKNGVGAFGGYVGILSPTSAFKTGLLENCYSSGRVEGVSAVGGLCGNLGKPKDGAVSCVRNCYSTCDVIGKYEKPESGDIQSGGGRTGGLIGIIWTGGILENSYAAGTVKSIYLYGAGGIVGFSDSAIRGCVALNDSILTNATTSNNSGKIGAIVGYMHPNSQKLSSGCWASESTVLNVMGSTIPFSEVRLYSFDGEIKDEKYIYSLVNYNSELNWDFMSEDNIWSQISVNRYPVFQWMTDRGDAELISGHQNLITNLIKNENSQTKVYFSNQRLWVTTDFVGEKRIEIRDIMGRLLFQTFTDQQKISYEFNHKGIFEVIILSENKSYVSKQINN